MGGAITRQRGSVALPPRGTSDARARSKSDSSSPHMRHIAVMSSQTSMTSKMNLIRATEEAFQGLRSPSLSGLSSMLSQSSQRSQRSLASQRSQQSQRSTRHSSVRESRASSTSSFKAFKFDAMLEPDAGSTHALVDSAFRVKAYKWILDQVARKAQAALEVHESYIDDDETEGELKLFAGGCVVDAARHRIVPMALDAVGSAMWATFTSSIDTDQWHVKCLEKVSESMCYAQVDVVKGIGDDESLVLNVLVQKVITPDRFVIVMRTVAEDHVYPLPKQSITFSVSGWIILDRKTATPQMHFGVDRTLRQTTRVRSLFRCRATRESHTHSVATTVTTEDIDTYAEDKTLLSEWTMDTIITFFHLIDATNTANFEQIAALFKQKR
ncbi:hypothetical protein AC1031_017464 [Aphanomyces cochlioides]|nr:hypothetical protein AC1031_017464 [Aphanomyces cochlioides]